MSACVDEVVNQSEVCQAFNKKIRVDLLLPADNFALRAIDLYSKYSLPLRVCAKNPEEVWHAAEGSRNAVCGRPKTIQMDSGGE